MPIKIHMLSLGALQTNCYILADTDTHEAIIIDPSADAEVILGVVATEGYTVREILITHGHFDHVLASKEVQEKTGAPVRIHEKDVPFLQISQKSAARYGIPAPEPATHDALIQEGAVFTVGSIRLDTLFTPGHAPGHVSFVLASEKVVFSGDCIFRDGIGRTDLPGGNTAVLMQSIHDKLLPLGDDFQICSGHGAVTTIGRERLHNPYLGQFADE